METKTNKYVLHNLNSYKLKCQHNNPTSFSLTLTEWSCERTNNNIIVPSYIVHHLLDKHGITNTHTSNVTEINDGAFENNNIIENVILPHTIESIGNNAFKNCKQLLNISFRNIYNDYVYFGESVFNGCENLKTIILPTSIKTIKQKTFKNCKSLTNIVIPKSVNKIDTQAFYGCENLSSITVLNPHINIKNNAFEGCNKLTHLAIDSHALNSVNTLFTNNKFNQIIVLRK